MMHGNTKIKFVIVASSWWSILFISMMHGQTNIEEGQKFRPDRIVLTLGRRKLGTVRFCAG